MIQRESPGSEGYLFKMARESLSEEVIVKLRWGKNILERGIDKVHIKAPRQGRDGESEVQGKGQCGWVYWPWGGEEGCSQRGGRGDTSHKTLRVLPHYLPTPQKIFLSQQKRTKTPSFAFEDEFCSPLWTGGHVVYTTFPFTRRPW